MLIQTRDLPEGYSFTDARLGIAIGDGSRCRSNSANFQYTPWASQGGGWSGWASDSSRNDFDCIQISLSSKVVVRGSITIKTAANGTNPPPPSTWILRNGTGGTVAQESTGDTDETYSNLPQGSYSIDPDFVKRKIDYQGRHYVLATGTECGEGVENPKAICPATTSNLGSTSGEGCLTNQFNPHTACSGNSCVVLASCGVSDCSACQNPGGDRDPPNRDVMRNPLPGIIPVARAFDGVTDPHNVCTPDNTCESVSGSGSNQCEVSSDCDDSAPPLPEPPAPTPPPKLTFTINYVVSGTGGAGGALGVSLSANPNSGASPLNTTLSANISGGSGPITYHFWKDCSSATTTLAYLRAPSRCGNESIVFTDVNDDPKAWPTSYSANGTYTAKVVAERGGLIGEDRETVTVNSIPAPSCLGPATTSRNATTTFTAAGGNGVFSWSVNSGDPSSGTGAQFLTKFNTLGLKTISVTSGGITRTCNTTVVTDEPTLRCYAPSTAIIFETVTSTASGGSGAYSWTATGTPATAGNVSAFGTSFGSLGTKHVTVRRGSQTAVCIIEIVAGPGTPGDNECTINVTSNVPSNWLIGGPTVNGDFIHSPNYPMPSIGATHFTDDDGNNLVRGTYGILVPNEIDGWTNPTVTPAASQYCPNGETINFNVSYANPPTVLTCSPSSQSSAYGAAANFSATGGAQPYTWYAQYGVPQTGTGTTFSPVFTASGERFVTVSNGVSSSTCSTFVQDARPPVFCSGPSSLNINQNGTWTGSGGDGSFTWGAYSQTPPNGTPQNGSGPSFTTKFTTPGQKNILVSSNGASKYCPVTVNNTSHFECAWNSCVAVPGPGVSRCSTNADCGPGNFGGVCDPVQRACVNRASPTGGTCGSDPDCAGPGPSHLECQNSSCVIVGGAGSDSCTEVGAACVGGPPPPAGTCTFTANPLVISRGDSSQLSWSCGGGLSACTVRNTLTSDVVTTGGGSGNVAVTPANTTPYSLNCNSGAFTGSVTVRVLSIIEVPPR